MPSSIELYEIENIEGLKTSEGVTKTNTKYERRKLLGNCAK